MWRWPTNGKEKYGIPLRSTVAHASLDPLSAMATLWQSDSTLTTTPQIEGLAPCGQRCKRSSYIHKINVDMKIWILVLNNLIPFDTEKVCNMTKTNDVRWAGQGLVLPVPRLRISGLDTVDSGSLLKITQSREDHQLNYLAHDTTEPLAISHPGYWATVPPPGQ